MYMCGFFVFFHLEKNLVNIKNSKFGINDKHQTICQTKCNIVFVFLFFVLFSFLLFYRFVVVVDILQYFSSIFNYTFNKNPGFWLVNSRCIFRVISYLGLISFNFTAAGVFARGFNCFTLWPVVFAKTYLTVLPSRASNRQIHSEYFLFTFICKVTWLIKFETRKCSDVNLKRCKIFTKTTNKRYYLFRQCSTGSGNCSSLD
jgi:hypothetical protein